MKDNIKKEVKIQRKASVGLKIEKELEGFVQQTLSVQTFCGGEGITVRKLRYIINNKFRIRQQLLKSAIFSMKKKNILGVDGHGVVYLPNQEEINIGKNSQIQSNNTSSKFSEGHG